MDKLSEKEIKNLSRLLMSEQDSNVELGLAILENSIMRVSLFYRELVLIWLLHHNTSLKEHARDYLALHYSDYMLRKWRKAFSLLLEWKTIKKDDEDLQKLLEDHEKILPKFQFFIEKHSRYGSFYYKTARHLHLNVKANLELVESYYRIALKANPNDEHCLYCLAYLLAESKDTVEEAIVLYQRAHIVNPTLDGVLYNIGYIYDWTYKDYAAAYFYYKDACQNSPKDSRYLRALARTCLRLKKKNKKYVEEAKEMLNLAITTEPKNHHNWKSMGDYYWNEEKAYQKAKKAYLQGLKVAPQNTLLLFNLAELYIYILKMYDIALVLLRKSIEQEALHYNLMVMVSLLVNKLDDLEEAKHYYIILDKISAYNIRQPSNINGYKWANFLAAKKKIFSAYPEFV